MLKAKTCENCHEEFLVGKNVKGRNYCQCCIEYNNLPSEKEIKERQTKNVKYKKQQDISKLVRTPYYD